MTQCSSRFGFGEQMDLDADEIEEYYRKKYNEDQAAISRFGKECEASF